MAVTSGTAREGDDARTPLPLAKRVKTEPAGPDAASRTPTIAASADGGGGAAAPINNNAPPIAVKKEEEAAVPQVCLARGWY